MAVSNSAGEQKWWVLVTVMIASFLGRLDSTIVNLALPKIIKEFGITTSQASWISTGYIIANAIFVPIFGKLGDLIGRKFLYIVGILGFTLTSMLAGMAFNLQLMVIFRIFQGITVSIDYPVALSIIAYTFQDKKERSEAMGLWSAVFAVAAVFGPLLGGPLIDNFSWRAVFYINLPLGLLGAYMAARFIEEPKREMKGLKNFDILGALLLGLFLGALVLVLDQGQSWGWLSVKSVINYLVVLTGLTSFIVVEKNAVEPVVDLKFFKIPSFTAALITSFITFMGLIGAMFVMPLFIQNYLGYSVTKTGLLFIPMAVGMMLGSTLGGKLSNRFQSRFVIAAGLLIGTLSLYSFSKIDLLWGAGELISRSFFLALGLGLGMAPLTTASTSTVPLNEVGVASSVLALVRNIAGAFGVAIFATILTNSITAQMSALQHYSFLNSNYISYLPLIMGMIGVKANILAFGKVFLIASIVVFFGSISAFFVKEDKERKKTQPKEEVIIEM